jgi:ribonuclease E
MDGVAYASLLARSAPKSSDPITAESMAEKPTRASRAKKPEPPPDQTVAAEPEAIADVEEERSGDEPAEEAAQAPRKRTRRGSRGGRGRKRKPVSASANGAGPDEGDDAGEGPVIHLPPPDLGAESSETEPEAAAAEPAPEENGGEPPKPRKRTRRGSRGGRGRRKKPASATAGDAPAETSD